MESKMEKRETIGCGRNDLKRKGEGEEGADLWPKTEKRKAKELFLTC